LKISISRDSLDSTDSTTSNGVLSLAFEPHLSRDQEDRIVRTLIGSEVCKQSLFMIGRGRWKTLEVVVLIKKSGKISTPDIEIQKNDSLIHKYPRAIEGISLKISV